MANFASRNGIANPYANMPVKNLPGWRKTIGNQATGSFEADMEVDTNSAREREAASATSATRAAASATRAAWLTSFEQQQQGRAQTAAWTFARPTTQAVPTGTWLGAVARPTTQAVPTGTWLGAVARPTTQARTQARTQAQRRELLVTQQRSVMAEMEENAKNLLTAISKGRAITRAEKANLRRTADVTNDIHLSDRIEVALHKIGEF